MNAFSEIVERHESLKNMASTQSPQLIAELRSQAHKDREVLIELAKLLQSDLDEAREAAEGLQSFIDEFVPHPQED